MLLYCLCRGDHRLSFFYPAADQKTVDAIAVVVVV